MLHSVCFDLSLLIVCSLHKHGSWVKPSGWVTCRAKPALLALGALF
jgi:hypothetical protein